MQCGKNIILKKYGPSKINGRKLEAGGKPSTWLPPGETRRAFFLCERPKPKTKNNRKQKQNVKATSKTLQNNELQGKPENMQKN